MPNPDLSKAIPIALDVAEFVTIVCQLIEKIPPEKRRAACDRVMKAVRSCKARCPRK